MAPFQHLPLLRSLEDLSRVEHIDHPDLSSIWLSVYSRRVHEGVANFAIEAQGRTRLQQSRAFGYLLDCLGALSMRDPDGVCPPCTIRVVADIAGTLPRRDAIATLARCSHYATAAPAAAPRC
jgi:hypothetical protein